MDPTKDWADYRAEELYAELDKTVTIKLENWPEDYEKVLNVIAATLRAVWKESIREENDSDL